MKKNNRKTQRTAPKTWPGVDKGGMTKKDSLRESQKVQRVLGGGLGNKESQDKRLRRKG